MSITESVSCIQWLPVAAAVVAIAASAVLLLRRGGLKLPPGPSGLSTLVAALFKHEDYMEYQAKWRKQFTKIYTTFLGRRPEVVMTDYGVIHGAFVDKADITSSRPRGLGALLVGVNEKGIIPSPHWREQRRFALTVLRDQGMGKIDMEKKILEEVGPFMQEIEKRNGEPLNVDSCVHQATSNIICNLVLGSRFEYNDEIFVSLIDKYLNQVKSVRKMFVMTAIPVLRWLPGDIFGYHQFMQRALKHREYFLTAIRQHAQNLDPNNPKDFIDAYLVEMKSRAETGQVSSFDEINCLAAVVQLFVAGTDTTATALQWAWLFMAVHSEIQQKVHDEIDERIGARTPSLADKAAMPYTEAVLTEVLRLGNVAPFTLQHKVDEDVNIGGYLIPKDTALTASLAAVHLDESTYPDPQRFDPGRFLNPEGRYEKPKKFVPFGIGRRVCVGESLARAELFLFFTSTMQNFIVGAPRGLSLSTRGKMGLTHQPLPHCLVFKRRQ